MKSACKGQNMTYSIDSANIVPLARYQFIIEYLQGFQLYFFRITRYAKAKVLKQLKAMFRISDLMLTLLNVPTHFC